MCVCVYMYVCIYVCIYDLSYWFYEMRLAEHKHTYMDTHQSITCMNCRLFLADSTIQVQLAERELAAAGWKRRLEDSDDYARAKGRANSKVVVCVRERVSVCLCVCVSVCV